MTSRQTRARLGERSSGEPVCLGEAGPVRPTHPQAQALGQAPDLCAGSLSSACSTPQTLLCASGFALSANALTLS